VRQLVVHVTPNEAVEKCAGSYLTVPPSPFDPIGSMPRYLKAQTDTSAEAHLSLEVLSMLLPHTVATSQSCGTG
jgi:hypothetical protein